MSTPSTYYTSQPRNLEFSSRTSTRTCSKIKIGPVPGFSSETGIITSCACHCAKSGTGICNRVTFSTPPCCKVSRSVRFSSTSGRAFGYCYASPETRTCHHSTHNTSPGSSTCSVKCDSTRKLSQHEHQLSGMITAGAAILIQTILIVRLE